MWRQLSAQTVIRSTATEGRELVDSCLTGMRVQGPICDRSAPLSEIPRVAVCSCKRGDCLCQALLSTRNGLDWGRTGTAASRNENGIADIRMPRCPRPGRPPTRHSTTVSERPKTASPLCMDRQLPFLPTDGCFTVGSSQSSRAVDRVRSRR